MSRLTSSLLAALVAGFLTAGGLYIHQRNHAREAARLRAENSRLRLEVAHRHAAKVAPPSAPVSAATASLATTPPPAKGSQTSPPSDYRNEGQNSPLATLQTFAWACDRGDSETIRDLLCFEGPGRAKAEAFMATLPTEIRARWNSPEAMAAELLTHQGMQQPFPAADILQRASAETLADGRVQLRLPGTSKDGTLYQKIGDRWHYVITEAVVDRYIADAAQRNAGPR